MGAVQARQVGEQALLLGLALANPHNLANLICEAQMHAQAGNRKVPWSNAEHTKCSLEMVSKLKSTYLTGRKNGTLEPLARETKPHNQRASKFPAP